MLTAGGESERMVLPAGGQSEKLVLPTDGDSMIAQSVLTSSGVECLSSHGLKKAGLVTAGS